jgi:hypothetical protein
MRSLIAIFALIVLSGCGAQKQLVTAAPEKTEIQVLARQLVGSVIRIGDSYQTTVRREDLVPYRMGVLGATDKDDERLERVAVVVDPGTHRVRVERDGKVLHEQTLYIGRGQVREVRVK